MRGTVGGSVIPAVFKRESSRCLFLRTPGMRGTVGGAVIPAVFKRESSRCSF